MRHNKILRTSVAVAAVTALLGACADSSADTDDKADDRPSSSTSAPEDEASVVLPEGVVALPAADTDADFATLDTGRYRVPLDETLSFDVDVPGPTYAHDGGTFLASGPVVVKTEIAGQQYGVPRDACSDHTIERTGPATDDLVEAILDQRLYETTRPTPVQLDGAEGTYLEIQIPATYDDSGCSGGVMLPTNPATAVDFEPGYRSRWWILDVDGRRVVIQQNCVCSADRLDRAAAIVESMTFTPAT